MNNKEWMRKIVLMPEPHPVQSRKPLEVDEENPYGEGRSITVFDYEQEDR